MWDFVFKRFIKYGSSVFFDKNSIIAYEEVCSFAIKHGNKLKEKLLPQTKCVILCSKGINCAISILACWYAGMIPVPLSVTYGKTHCERIIDLVQPGLLITDSDEFNLNIPKYNLLKGNYLGIVKRITSAENELSDVAIIMCTSGTTGIPKAALITKFALQTNVIKISEYFMLCKADRILIARPLYHCAVLTGEFLIALYKGLDIGFFDEKYNPGNVLKFAVQYKINVLCGTPTLLNHISLFIQRNNIIHEIRKIAVSGECLSSSIAKNIRNGFLKTEIYNVYGLTEASPRISYLPHHLFDIYPESVGLPLSDILIKILDKNYCELPAKEQGLIYVKTPCLMKGYYKNEQLTKGVLFNEWLNTGDVGYLDENGYLYVLSRSDDMIIKAGMNIYPKEIERALDTIAEIKECVAYGYNTMYGQEIAVDLVINDEYENITKKYLLKKITNVLPEFQIPSRINFVEALNRNASGKMIRGHGKEVN